MNIPVFRAKCIEGNIPQHLKIKKGDYIVGSLVGNYIIYNKQPLRIDPTTLAIKMPERDFFISLDVESGKGGDKISENKVLFWNGEMMNCSVIQFDEDGKREDYLIDFNNLDYDEMKVIGIQK